MKMKRPNKHVVRAVAATTAASMLLPMCQPFVNSIVISEDLPARGTHAIELDLSRAELDYLRFLQRLSDDIIRNPEIAQAFVRNPQLFLEQYGFHHPIDLDENMLRLTLALGDQDINSAINAGDISLVLSLMEEKGILTDLTNSFINFNISEEQAREILLAMGIIKDDMCPNFPIDDGGGGGGFVCIPFPGVCIAVVLVVFHIAAAVTTVAAAAVAVHAYLAAHARVEVWGVSSNGFKFLDSNSPLRIWSLKGKPNDTYIAVDMYLENQVNKVIDLVKSHNISFDEEKMRNFLKLNLLMQNN